MNPNQPLIDGLNHALESGIEILKNVADLQDRRFRALIAKDPAQCQGCILKLWELTSQQPSHNYFKPRRFL